jgi:hypothetical protein
VSRVAIPREDGETIQTYTIYKSAAKKVKLVDNTPLDGTIPDRDLN